jgi:cysteine-rich repeat protein
VLECDGAGNSRSVADNLDAPPDADTSDCGEPACASGGVTSANKPKGTVCVVLSGDVCDGSGQCVTNVCGDLITKIGSEQCDDGNAMDGDGCSGYCVVEAGWRCDPHQSCVPVCGDGVVTGSEQCDDSNVLNADGCSEFCQQEVGFSCTGTSPSTCVSICGDGLVVGNEACDDNNTQAGDGCSSSCTVDPGYDCQGTPSVCGCSAGMTACGGGCVDVTSSPANCGSCGFTCTFSNATAVCTNSQCGIGTCNQDYGNCDGTDANGCETFVANDINNCGTCGNTCSPGLMCISGSCVVPP